VSFSVGPKKGKSMLDLDELYFNSDPYRNLLEKIGNEIRLEDIAERSGDLIAAYKHGLKVWDYLLKLMKMTGAQSIYELDAGGAPIYDLLYWAATFVDNLHNASIRDKSFEKHKLSFCEAYVDMHRGMFDKDVRNLGNIRTSLAECYFKLGKSEKTDDLFREWLSAEPTWGFGWTGWSDLYWLWNSGIEKDFKKAEKILKEGLKVPKVNDREHIKERLAELKKAKKSNIRPTCH
jgi:tetratricopeptide (TPR) repeat protein